MTHPLTLQVPSEVFEPLSDAAKRAGTTPESVAVAWLTAASRHPDPFDKSIGAINKLPEGAPEEIDPLQEFIGAFPSEVPDWVDQHDKHLADIVMDPHDDERSSQ